MIPESGPFEATIVVRDYAQLAAVYALLGGVSVAAVASAAPAPKAPAAAVAAKPATEQPSAGGETPVQEGPASAGSGPSATSGASPSKAEADLSAMGEVDTGGHPWSEALHASTKTKTKDGYWRMKVGVLRPANLAGFPSAAGATAAAAPSTAASPSQSAADAGPASASAAAPSSQPASAVEEDDEFAAFAAADAATAETGPIPPRTWSDADLSTLCNQAAQKFGQPGPVKELITEFVPAGEVPHSRNIPADKREDFAKAVEAKAGFTFAG